MPARFVTMNHDDPLAGPPNTSKGRSGTSAKIMYVCRECENEINQATELCPHCGADLTAPIPGAETPRAKPGLGKILLRWGVLLGVLLAAIWSFLWFVVSPRTGNVALEAETQAVQSMDEVHSALASYAQAQGGIYPETLE